MARVGRVGAHERVSAWEDSGCPLAVRAAVAPAPQDQAS